MAGCNTRSGNRHFRTFYDQETVAIYLNKFKLDSIPAEIGKLAQVKRLSISKDSSDGWTIYPPLSALSMWRQKPPFRHLPDEITRLRNLHSLILVNLDLIDLPDNFDELDNLDSLDLGMNKLTISRELDVLKGLKNLKYLGLLGNAVTTTDIETLQKAIPGLIIDSDLDRGNIEPLRR